MIRLTPSLHHVPRLALGLALAWPAFGAQEKKAPPPAKTPASQATAADRPPVPFQQSRPAYPESLRSYRIRGEVRVAYDVDADGYVKNLRALYATHPEFLKPALDVAAGWRFRPARRNGQPVEALGREESIFSDVVTPGPNPFAIPYVPDEKLPEPFRYDRPPAIKTLVPVVYPYEQLLKGRQGAAEVAFVVGPDGRAREITVRMASEPEFGHALEAAMSAWVFDPPMRNGEPAGAVLVRGQLFSVNGEDRLVSEGTRRVLSLLAAEQPAIFPMEALDAPPTGRRQTAPVFPLKHAGKNGSAEVEFIIDRDGKVHLPKVLSATEPEFGWSAATAINTWEFDPPNKDGAPVDARIHLQIDFRGVVEDGTGNSTPANESKPVEAAKPTV